MIENQDKCVAEVEMQMQEMSLQKRSDENTVTMTNTLLNQNLKLENGLKENKTELDKFSYTFTTKMYKQKYETLKAKHLMEKLVFERRLDEFEIENDDLRLQLYEYKQKCKALEENLQFEKQLVRVGVKSEKEEFVQKLQKFIETDFTCSVCTDVFIEATVLGSCGHTFCNTCISSWFQNRSNCPICRKPISSKSTQPELKNFISRVYEIMPDEIRSKRAKDIEERQLTAMAIATPNNNNNAYNNVPINAQQWHEEIMRVVHDLGGGGTMRIRRVSMGNSFVSVISFD